ncbi:conserved hypothetical protein [Ricinus communis]|uniref:Uncharacterized protein n=1 Tax=Ricinus communis TaxID=3988 RepID=B9SWE0_RICCO|nr:conserved hypothetical protein [Ricinus communis]
MMPPKPFSAQSKLARSREAHLIVIECNSEDKKDDYDIRKIHKLNIDTKSFDVRKVISDLSIMLSYMEKNEVSKEMSQLFYMCKDPNLNIHFKCILDESYVDCLVSKKKLKQVYPQGIGQPVIYPEFDI